MCLGGYFAPATSYGAEEFFLCADNTYDECGSIASAQRFDYIPIQSKYKRPAN